MVTCYLRDINVSEVIISKLQTLKYIEKCLNAINVVECFCKTLRSMEKHTSYIYLYFPFNEGFS